MSGREQQHQHRGSAKVCAGMFYAHRNDLRLLVACPVQECVCVGGQMSSAGCLGGGKRHQSILILKGSRALMYLAYPAIKTIVARYLC